ncbi:hypothetical protein [Streptomyces sp. NPDC058731]|uniref:hypothetical protein n=1 Tax=Streptomyces sp. NPDC058731 TaxID=3346613 RepID=UPI00368E73B1
MKKAMAGVLAAGAFLLSAGTALGTPGWHGVSTIEGSGVRFHSGEYRFNPAHQNHGAFEWRGKLEDADKKDGHNVYMQVRIEGHGWVRYNGKQNTTVALHQSNWDGAQLYTSHAYMRACRDKGSLQPDNCSPTVHFVNPKALKG